MNLKTLTCIVSLAFLVWACHSRSSATGGVTITDSVLQKIQVAYTGKFNKGLISLVINYISGNTVSGYDVHLGRRRNLNGEVTQQGKLLSFVLKEPGGNPTDGRFEFVLDPDSMKLVGKWIPFDTTKASVHNFILAQGKVEFNYEELWCGQTGTDTVLIFKPDGICTFEFYPHGASATDERSAKEIDSAATAARSNPSGTDSAATATAAAPENPTDQLISVRGNYTKEGLTYKIEWEKNPYIPLHMTLVKELKEYKQDDGTVESYPIALRGDGFSFARSGDEGD